jgi:iron complex transport system permease protein
VRVVAAPGSTHPAARGRLQNVIIFILVALLIAAFIISFTLGRYPISFDQLINAFYLKITQNGTSPNDTTQAVLFDVRLPRIIAATLVGSALSVSGATIVIVLKKRYRYNGLPNC